MPGNGVGMSSNDEPASESDNAQVSGAEGETSPHNSDDAAPSWPLNTAERLETASAERIELRELEGELRATRSELERQRGEVDAQRRTLCLLYTSPSPRDGLLSRMPSSA